MIVTRFEKGSDAYEEIRRAFDEGRDFSVLLETPETVKVKIGEDIWTLPLSLLHSKW